MMKKATILLLLASSMALASHAQMPGWVIKPDNDSIYIKVDKKLIEGKAGAKSMIWDMNGNMIYSTDDVILPFKDGVAVVQARNQPVLKGFIDEAGKFTALPDVKIAFSNPFFEDGYLLCLDKGKEVYYKKDGSKADFPDVLMSYPFHKGYAPYFMYDNIDKRKDPHYGYFKADGQEMRYLVKDNGNVKSLDPKDISFLSGIGATGKGVGVIKNKLYWFDIASGTFEPLEYGDAESPKRRHLSLDGDYEQFFLNLPVDNIVINAKYDKNKFAELNFDHELRPVLFTFDGQEMTFREKPGTTNDPETKVGEYQMDGKYGLTYDSKQVLPSQFDAVGYKYNNWAFVKYNGKWGIVEIYPNADYNLKINKGEDIAFRHQKFDTQIRLDLPPRISSKEVRIDIPEGSGLLLDKTSRECKDTESGNFVTYNCVLTIPTSLPDTITSIIYEPVEVTNEGISLFPTTLPVRAWHYKYYNVDPIDSETSIADGVLTFTVNINAQRNVGEGDYPFELRIEADSVFIEQDKLSETRRKFVVSNLQEGSNYLNIYVTETGCPTQTFPFEIIYTKPQPKKKETEKADIRKLSQPKSPRLEL